VGRVGPEMLGIPCDVLEVIEVGWVVVVIEIEEPVVLGGLPAPVEKVECVDAALEDSLLLVDEIELEVEVLESGRVVLLAKEELEAERLVVTPRVLEEV